MTKYFYCLLKDFFVLVYLSIIKTYKTIIYVDSFADFCFNKLGPVSGPPSETGELNRIKHRIPFIRQDHQKFRMNVIRCSFYLYTDTRTFSGKTVRPLLFVFIQASRELNLSSLVVGWAEPAHILQFLFHYILIRYLDCLKEPLCFCQARYNQLRGTVSKPLY